MADRITDRASQPRVEVVPFEQDHTTDVTALIRRSKFVHRGELFLGHVIEEALVDRYFGSYQRDQVIARTAVAGRQVIGFIGALRWPLRHDGESISSYQLGHLVVADDFPGTATRLLEALHARIDDLGVAVVICFPPPAVAALLVSQGWLRSVRLQWYSRMLRPALRRHPPPPAGPLNTPGRAPLAGFTIDPDPAFTTWRSDSRDSPVVGHRVPSRTANVEFELRVVRRAHRARELIIGSAVSDSANVGTWSLALEQCIGAARAMRAAPLVSIALNPLADSPPVFALRRSHFAPMRRSLCLLARVHPERADLVTQVADPSAWPLGAAAVATW